MNTKIPGQLERAIGRWGLTALVLNSIIGSGIFGLPSLVAVRLGSASTYAYLLAAGGVGLIMACFAEVASDSPGPAGHTCMPARRSAASSASRWAGWPGWFG